MKKTLFALFAAAAVLLTGCAKEKIEKNIGTGDQLTTFTVNLESSSTRAVADNDGNGAEVNHWVMEILDADGDRYSYQADDAEEGVLTHTFKVSLVKGQTYNVLFWADTKGSYIVDSLTNVKLADASGYAANLDSRDAFSAVVANFESTQASSQNVTLKRPLAQMNIIFTDLKKLFQTMGSSETEYAKFKPTEFVAKAKIPTSFNILTQQAGTPATTTLTITAEENYLDNYTTKKDTATLFMDYFLATADEKDLVDVTFSFKSKGATISHEFNAVPFQRNYRTNIKGDLMSSSATWNVEVNPIWESSQSGKQEIAYDVVNDIQGANAVIAKEIANGKKEISIKFASEPNDAGVPGTAGDTTRAIVTTGLPANGALNILVEAQTKSLYIGDYTTEIDTTLVTSGTNAAVVNVNIPDTSGIKKLVINAPSKTVYLNGLQVAAGVLDTVEAVTSQNTLIVEQGQTINKLTMNQGGLEIHGTVGALVINETDHDNNPVKVRKCENLSQEVFDVIYKTGEGAHDYIDRPAFVEKANGTTPQTWDIVPADPVAKIGETKYYTLADAVAAANDTTGATIELLKNVSVSSSLTIEKDMTLDLDGHNITCGVASGRPLLVKSNTSFTVKDGVFVDGTNDASYGAIDTRIGGVAQSNVTINVSNVDFGVFDGDGNCTSPFNTNNGAIVKFRSAGTCVLTDVRAASDHYILDHTGAVPTTVTRGKYIVNHPNPCGDLGCSQNVAAFNLPYGTNVMTDVIVTTTNCKASVSCGNTSGTACNLDISGCNFTSDQNAIAAAGLSVLNVTSGTYTASGDAVHVMTSGGTVNIHGGTFVGTTNALFANVNTSQYPSAVATINVYGGQIKGNMTLSSSPTFINLYGGIYSVEPSTTEATVAFGFKQAANPDAQTSSEYPWTVAAPVQDAEVSIAKTGLPTGYATMNELSQKVNQGEYFRGYTVTVLKDIDLTNNQWVPMGTYDYEKAFCGIFDGDNHKITLTKTGITDDYGLFVLVYGFEQEHPAIVRNLNLEVNLTAQAETKTWIGGVSDMTGGYTRFENIVVTGSIVTGRMGGGFTGYNAGGTCVFENCTNKASVTAVIPTNASDNYSIIGGISAQAGGASVTYINCRNEGVLSANHSGDTDSPSYLGHMVGKGNYNSNDLTITNCTFSQNATITGWNVKEGDHNTYAFEGVISSTGTNTYTTAPNTGKLMVGGYFGTCNLDGTVQNSIYPNGK